MKQEMDVYDKILASNNKLIEINEGLVEVNKGWQELATNLLALLKDAQRKAGDKHEAHLQ